MPLIPTVYYRQGNRVSGRNGSEEMRYQKRVYELRGVYRYRRRKRRTVRMYWCSDVNIDASEDYRCSLAGWPSLPFAMLVVVRMHFWVCFVCAYPAAVSRNVSEDESIGSTGI
jgi:hypothetical protein